MISTRRLLARPSAVRLSATGSSSPRPDALIRSGETPELTRNERTDSARGMGPDRPIADNKSAEGRANNRRVEIIIDESGATRTSQR